MILYATLAVCAALLALLISRYDMYDRERWYMLVWAALLGVGAMWGIGYVERLVLSQGGEPPISAPIIATVAAVCEELARLVVVLTIAILVPRHFNDPMDGIIYGSVVGLGMAIDESLFFLDLWKTPGPLLPPSEIIRLVGHLVMGGITGFAIGMMRMKMPGWGLALIGCLTVSMTYHFFWDWIAFAAGRAGKMQWWQTIAAVALMLGGIFFYGMLVVIGSDWSRKVFAPQSAKRLWGWPVVLMMRGKSTAPSTTTPDDLPRVT